MKRIIIFRHGEYDGSGELDADGAKAVFAPGKADPAGNGPRRNGFHFSGTPVQTDGTGDRAGNGRG